MCIRDSLIPDAAHGDDLEILAVTETVAQPADMNIDGVRVGVGIIAPYIVNELLTSKDGKGMSKSQKSAPAKRSKIN